MIKDKLRLCFGSELRRIFDEIDSEIIEEALEIRIRTGRNFIIRKSDNEYISSYKITKKDIMEMTQMISDYSPYAFENEIKNGFITISGGFRIGICGTYVSSTIKNITGFNIRICRQIKGCAESIAEIFFKLKTNILIASPPNCGKTTVLRDLIRIVSDSGYNVSVVDERSEIAGTYMGEAVNDVGLRTDVMDKVPKYIGMMMLLRSMSPEIIAVDEIGSEEDITAINTINGSGALVFATLHCMDKNELEIKRNITDKFGLVILLKGVGEISAVYGNGGFS